MTLRDTYTRFLAAPSTGALAENATLHYITTLTSLQDATAIIKHLSVQEKLLKKKNEKVLSAVEGHLGLCLDVETTIEFQNGGGAYLPGLDDNFVADRTVTFPMVHMVHFDNAGKINQIRLYWDQGALLKQIDVIGARSRNWPIRDSKEQSRLIASSSAAVAPLESAPSTRRSTASRGTDEVSVTSRSRGSTENAMNDPHASLALFAPRSVEDDNGNTPRPIAPRAQSAKPPPREYSELFVGENPGSPSPSNERIPVKAGTSKNYKQNRLFEETEEERAEAAAATPAHKGIKTNSKKYDHFAFGDGEDTPAVKRSESRGRHTANWDFEDFATPAKVKTKTQPNAVRHFGWSDDEDEGSPVRRPIVHKARPDADPHFEFVDDGTPAADRKPSVSNKGRVANKGMGLYQDHVTGTTKNDKDDGPYDDDVKGPLSDVTHNIKNENRSKDFGAHWDMTDDSPAASKNAARERQPGVDHKATKNNWSLYQESPETRGGINIAGNGMGGRKGTEAAWSLFDESSPAKKENTNTNIDTTTKPISKPRGIRTEGDGMGGKKGADSFWDF